MIAAAFSLARAGDRSPRALLAELLRGESESVGVIEGEGSAPTARGGGARWSVVERACGDPRLHVRGRGRRRRWAAGRHVAVEPGERRGARDGELRRRAVDVAGVLQRRVAVRLVCCTGRPSACCPPLRAHAVPAHTHQDGRFGVVTRLGVERHHRQLRQQRHHRQLRQQCAVDRATSTTRPSRRGCGSPDK